MTMIDIQTNTNVTVKSKLISDYLTKTGKHYEEFTNDLQKYKFLDTQRLIEAAFNEIASDPKLRTCTVESVLSAVTSCAAHGLMPNRSLDLVLFTPYNNVCKFSLSYKGMREIIYNISDVEFFNSQVIYDTDEFICEFGDHIKITHNLKLTGRKDIQGAYAICRMKDGTTYAEVLSTEEINLVRDTYARESPAWKKSWSQMARKTAIRRLFPTLPLKLSEKFASIMENFRDDDTDINTKEAANVKGNYGTVIDQEESPLEEVARIAAEG